MRRACLQVRVRLQGNEAAKPFRRLRKEVPGRKGPEAGAFLVYSRTVNRPVQLEWSE